VGINGSRGEGNGTAKPLLGWLGSPWQCFWVSYT